MAAKGSYAKENLINKLKEVYGNDFVGVYDKKAYVWEDDAGERVQLCVSLTCPKIPMGDLSVYTHGDRLEFDQPVPAVETPEISKEEKDNIQALMERLGL